MAPWTEGSTHGTLCCFNESCTLSLSLSQVSMCWYHSLFHGIPLVLAVVEWMVTGLVLTSYWSRCCRILIIFLLGILLQLPSLVTVLRYIPLRYFQFFLTLWEGHWGLGTFVCFFYIPSKFNARLSILSSSATTLIVTSHKRPVYILLEKMLWCCQRNQFRKFYTFQKSSS